ncbi:MAG: VOC family protein [Anaerolineales bacterium]|nr:VOC family protein [Anaerolineales bacterium]
MKLNPRESVIFAEDFQAMKAWYRDVLGFAVTRSHEEDYHYCNLENEQGIRLGIADAKEMAVTPSDRQNNSVVLQFEVADVKGFFAYLQEKGGNITFGPSFDTKNGFWYGGFHDLEGNPFWVVDENCP